MWKELVGWLLFFVKWEGAVVNWKLAGHSELYTSIAATAGVCIELVFILVFFEIVIRGIRVLRVRLRERRLLPQGLKRMKLNGKGKRKPSRGTSIAAWLAERKLGITARYIAIFLLAAMPIIPYLEFAAIVLAKATKSRYGYLVVFIGTTLKVLATIHVIYHW